MGEVGKASIRKRGSFQARKHSQGCRMCSLTPRVLLVTQILYERKFDLAYGGASERSNKSHCPQKTLSLFLRGLFYFCRPS